MSSNNESSLSRSRSLKERGDLHEALEAVELYIRDNPECLDGIREKADIYELMNDQPNHYENRKRLIELNTIEPADYYDYIRILILLGKNEDVIKCADTCIELCNKYDNMYYIQATYYWKTIALLALSSFDEASVSCGFLEPGYKTHVHNRGMVSKEMLLEDINVGISAKKAKNKKWIFPNEE